MTRARTPWLGSALSALACHSRVCMPHVATNIGVCASVGGSRLRCAQAKFCKVISSSNVTILEEIGRGSFKTVHRAELRVPGSHRDRPMVSYPRHLTSVGYLAPRCQCVFGGGRAGSL